MNATYDGQLKIDNEVIGDDDERRELITHVEVIAGVKIIHKEALSDCTALASVVLPEGLKEIVARAFYGCTALSSISVPDSLPVNGIQPDAFSECTLLSELSSAKRMDVEQFLRWRRRAPRQRYAVLASLLRLRTELYARPKKRAALEQEDAEEDGAEEGDGGQSDGGRLLGALAFDIITSDDVWRYILEFV